ncbi:MAG: PEGA domain-containing protein [Clostridium sp.]|nr:PEGA domain-containing protein [Clostridium sp.]MCM1399089.1 PEGA domain-containing protein [Clostridium sp.]MCM1459481.1 PEGA domain-containing protein [Bacteroides sp.]
MRKNVLLLSLILLLVLVCGCGDSGKIKVYDNTETLPEGHKETTMTAVVTRLEADSDIIEFMDCYSGKCTELSYHGGVSITNTYGKDVGLMGLTCGSVVDVVYYFDTSRLVSIAMNENVLNIDDVSKLSVDKENLKAVYKGRSYEMYDYVVAFDENEPLDIMEINTEDKVTLSIFNGRLISIRVVEGHGYVRLYNHDTYIGGMVELGNDVIVPVTGDMLVAVREGSYTLRISKNGYSDSKDITVMKDNETRVDIGSIAIPTGTVTINVTPSDAKVYIDNNIDEDHVFTGAYGDYSLRIEADGYKTFRGSFTISEPAKSYKFTLKENKDATTEATTEATTTEKATDGDSSPKTTTSSGKTTTETTEAVETNNKITIKAPVGVGVYLDGEYMGEAPVTFPKTVGTHTVTLYKTGYLIKSYTIQSTNNGKDDEYSFAALTSVLSMNE